VREKWIGSLSNIAFNQSRWYLSLRWSSWYYGFSFRHRFFWQPIKKFVSQHCNPSVDVCQRGENSKRDTNYTSVLAVHDPYIISTGLSRFIKLAQVLVSEPEISLTGTDITMASSSQ
jgi:hypothetical protein